MRKLFRLLFIGDIIGPTETTSKAETAYDMASLGENTMGVSSPRGIFYL
jgi:hypothetical protein